MSETDAPPPTVPDQAPLPPVEIPTAPAPAPEEGPTQAEARVLTLEEITRHRERLVRLLDLPEQTFQQLLARVIAGPTPPPIRGRRRLVVMTDVPGPDLAKILSPQLELQLLAHIDLLTRAAMSSDPRCFLRAADMVMATTEALERLVEASAKPATAVAA